MRDEDEYTRTELTDLSIAIGLLAGFSEKDDRGLPKKRYYKEEGENEPRRALARLLRNQKPLDSALRCQLAALFDPDPETAATGYSTFEGVPIERRIVFEKRGRGRGHETLRSIGIAYEVLERREFHTRNGESTAVTLAIGDVADKYGVDERTVSAAWQWARKQHPRTFTIK